MSNDNGVAPIGSSADVGWVDGKPRAPVSEEAKKFLMGGGTRVTESQLAGRMPRPRSKNVPQPASLVNYNEVPRNTMDNIDFEGTKLEDLVLQNAEAMKQFEYLEKSLVSFKSAIEEQTAQLRQPSETVKKKSNISGLTESTDPDKSVVVEERKKFRKERGVIEEYQTLQGASPIYPDSLFGRSDAMNPLGNVYAEGDADYEDRHLQPLDPIIVEGEGYLYGIRSVQIVAFKESVRGSDFIFTSSGPNHSAAVTAAGQIYSWGANDMRQLGYPGAEEGILGIDMDPRPIDALQGLVVTAAACGKHHTTVITEEGQIWSWGAFGNGQLGVGEISKEKFPHGYVDPMRVQALDTQAPRAVACGNYHTVLVDGYGDIWTCGTGDNHAHGQDTHFDVATPMILNKVSNLDFRQVACGAAHTIALTANGLLFSWGLNEHGQLGLGDLVSRKTATQNESVQGKHIRKIACGEAHSAFLSDRDVYTFGDGSHGALGHGNSKTQIGPKAVIKLTEDCRLREVECGPQYTVALSDLGQLYFWGNMKSTSGRGSKHVFNMPRRFKGLEAIYGVACGEHEITALVRIPIAPPLEHKFKAGVFVEEAGGGIIEGYIGRVCTWGKAADGKLGHGAGMLTQADLKTPFAVYGPLYHFSVIVCACGEDHSACITDNGQIYTWGSNTEGQLGLKDFKTRLQPTRIEACCDPDVPRLKNTKNKVYTDIIAGNWHNLAITSKKKVYAWGKNKYGQLGLGHTNNMHTPTSILPLSDPLNPKNVRCIAAGKSHSAIIAEDGDVYTWGRGWDGQLGHDVITEIELEPRIVPEMENRASAAAACGRAHTVVITDNGNVWSWGDNKCGQLGLGNLNRSSTPKLVKTLEEQEVTHVACGADHTIVITIANEVYGFGNGVYDQLGLGTLGLFPQPQRIPGLTAVPRIQSVVCGTNSTAVVGGDDTAYLLGTWDGINTFVGSKLSKYATVKRSTKGTTPDVLETPLGIEEIKAISLGSHHGMVIGLEEDGQRLIQKRLDFERQEVIKAMDDHAGDMLNSATTDRNKRRELITPFVSYDHGGEPFPDETCNPDVVAKVERPEIDPRTAGMDDASVFSMGDDGATEADESDAASRRSGTSKKSSRTAMSQRASQAEGRSVAAGEGRQISMGYKGFMIAWGDNKYNQLGLAKTKDKKRTLSSYKPVKHPSDQVAVPPTLVKYPDTVGINLPSVSTVSCGEYHTLAVCQDGTLWSWGRNQCGQLGHGDTKDKYIMPTQVMALAKKICIKAAAGGQHSLVLTDANKIYGWGSNNFGQLGMNITDKVLPRPDILSSMRRSGACHVVCGYSHSVALLKNEQIYAWGRNDCGQLGLGHYTHSAVPEHVTALKRYQVQQVGCGYDHCIAFVAEDKGKDIPPVEHVYTWGRGEEGQLGHNDYFSRCVPRIVATLEARGVRAIAAGGFSSAAIDEAKQIYTWGDSREGQLGHGDDTSLNTPTIVKKPFSEDEIRPDVQGTFRARIVFVGPSYMLAMGLTEEDEKKEDPRNDRKDLEKYSWGCNGTGQLGMPYLNQRKRKAGGARKLAPEKIPFLTPWPMKEISCGLEHVVAVVDLKNVEDQATGQMSANVDLLEKDLNHLASGELEEDVRKDQKKDHHGDGVMAINNDLKTQKRDLGYDSGGEDDDDAVEGEPFNENEDALWWNLQYEKQIFDRFTDVSPLVIRIGLDHYAPLFKEQNITFYTFLTITDHDLQEMGVTTFGARRRLIRAVRELQAARPAPELTDGVENDEFVPPSYEREEQQGYVALKKGHLHHPADFIEEDDLGAIPEHQPMLALPFARNTTNMASHSAYPGQNGYSAAGGDSARTFEQQPTAQAPPHMNNGPVPHEHDQDSGNFLNGFSLPFMPSVFGSRP